jgi:tetratricopeptide (TPR) repeat protein
MRPGRHLFLMLCVASLWSVAAQAGEVATKPTDLEWATWPEYCRARFVVSAGGRESTHVKDVSKATIALWESRTGGWWYALHHHCAALIQNQRARVEADPAKRNYMLKTAVRDLQFTIARTPETNPGYIESTTQLAFTLEQMGDVKAALEYLDAAIKLNPTAAKAYAAKAMVLRNKKDPEGALAALVAGNEAVQGKSAELHYFLGLTYLDLRQYDQAQIHAREAYAMGHQLPGLRRKLADLGFALD